MKQKRLLLFIGIMFAAVGLTFLGLCIFQNGNQLFLNIGLLCNTVAFVIRCIANKKEK